MPDIETHHADNVRLLTMKGGATLIIQSDGYKKEFHFVLTSPAVDALARQLAQRDTPPSRNDSAQ